MSNTTQPTDEVARRVLDNLERHVNNGDPLSAEARQYLARMQERDEQEFRQERQNEPWTEPEPEQTERERAYGLVATGPTVLQSEFMPDTRVEPGQRLAYDPVNDHWVGVDEARGRDWTTGVVVGVSDGGMAQVQFSTMENPVQPASPNNLLSSTEQMLENMRRRNANLLRGTQQQRGNLDMIEEEQGKKKRKKKATTVNTGGVRKVLRRKRKS